MNAGSIFSVVSEVSNSVVSISYDITSSSSATSEIDVSVFNYAVTGYMKKNEKKLAYLLF